MSRIEVKDKLIKRGIEKGLIRIQDDRISYIIQGKTYDFTDPEEPIRARTYCNLVFNFEYSANRIDFEVVAPARVPPYPADIVVYREDETTRVYAVVETKATSRRSDIDEAKREGLGNANLLRAQFLLVVCGEFEATYDLKEHPPLIALDKYRIPVIPKRYGKVPKYRYTKGAGAFFDLRKANLNELMNRFQMCHDAIWEGGKRDPAVAFDEMSKLMFTKIYDEELTKTEEPYGFQIGTYEDERIIGSRLRKIYKDVQEVEPEVFEKPIEASDHIIFEVVKNLQDISLIKTDLDAKGKAFERFLGKVFRGEFGQFFTDRRIVNFMVRMLDPTEKDLVMDPACGSGGFLLYSINLVREKLKENYKGFPDTIRRLDWRFSHDHVFGIEINDRIARVAMMDMVIHDDGHTNIECNDALTDYRNFDPRRDIKPNKYIVILTNPPFGAVEKRQEILNQFELGSKIKKRNAQRKEILFIERCLDLLRAPAGKMGIILPDGVLTNVVLQYVRDFIDRKAKILAVISLPSHAFLPFGSGVKASLLFLQKKEREGEDIGDYRIFMAHADHIGYDATGRPDKNELPEILKEYQRFSQDPKTYRGK